MTGPPPSHPIPSGSSPSTPCPAQNGHAGTPCHLSEYSCTPSGRVAGETWRVFETLTPASLRWQRGTGARLTQRTAAGAPTLGRDLQVPAGSLMVRRDAASSPTRHFHAQLVRPGLFGFAADPGVCCCERQPSASGHGPRPRRSRPTQRTGSIPGACYHRPHRNPTAQPPTPCLRPYSRARVYVIVSEVY